LKLALQVGLVQVELNRDCDIPDLLQLATNIVIEAGRVWNNAN
jgi:hypothetical protein